MTTPIDLSSSLRAVLLAVLQARAPSNALGKASAVYETLPASPAFPYLTIGESRFRPLSEEGGEYFFTLSIWSNKDSPQEVHAIAADIQAALDEVLTGDDFHDTRFALRQSRVLRQSRGKVWHAELTGRVFAQAKTAAPSS